MPRLPPPLCVSYAIPIRLRTIVDSSVSSINFTRGSLANACGSVCTVTNSTVIGIMGTFRLHKIIAWPAGGGAVTVSWNVTGGAELALTKDKVMINSLPTGITEDVGMVFSPPKKSVVGDWQVATINPTDRLLSMSATSGSIVDFLFVATLANQYGGQSSTVAAGILGGFYYLPPDGPTTHHFAPEGVPTTF